MCNKVDNSCRDEKRGCDGCAYNKEETEIGELHIGGMVIKTKYQIGQRVWLVSENEPHKEVEVFSDVIDQVVIYNDGEIYYFLKELCDDVKEDKLIPYEDTERLLQEIIDIDNRLNFKEENK